MIYRYPVTLRRDADDGSYTVAFPDFPEAITYGATVDAALVAAIDALDEALASRVHGDEPVPPPSRIRKYAVEPTLLIAAKVALYETVAAAGIRKTWLARRLDVNENEVRRMLDPYHATKLSRIERALALLGKRLSVTVVDAPAGKPAP